MAKKAKAAAEQRYPKQHDDDGGNQPDAPLDRPDQIQLDGSEGPEEISIFESSRAGEDVDLPALREEEDRSPAVASREQRARTDEGTALPDRPQRKSAEREGDEDAGYSKKVQRRINREVALRKRADARLAEERTARQQLEQRLAKVERAQVDEQGQASMRELEAKIREITTKLAAAKEANDTTAEVTLQVELGDLQGKKILLQSQQQNAKQLRERAQATAKQDDDTAVPNRGRGSDWIRAQRRWWSTSRWAGAHDDAIQHDTTILQEIEDGDVDFEPYSDEHFEELSRRLKADYPDLEVRTVEGDVFEELTDDDLDDDVRNERREHMSQRDDERDEDRRAARDSKPTRRAPMGGLGGRDGRRERNRVEMARRGKIELTPDDFAAMRVFKLDPNNAEHKKAFAKERARTILRDANNGAIRR